MYNAETNQIKDTKCKRSVKVTIKAKNKKTKKQLHLVEIKMKSNEMKGEMRRNGVRMKRNEQRNKYLTYSKYNGRAEYFSIAV